MLPKCPRWISDQVPYNWKCFKGSPVAAQLIILWKAFPLVYLQPSSQGVSHIFLPGPSFATLRSVCSSVAWGAETGGRTPTRGLVSVREVPALSRTHYCEPVFCNTCRVSQVTGSSSQKNCGDEMVTAQKALALPLFLSFSGNDVTNNIFTF